MQSESWSPCFVNYQVTFWLVRVRLGRLGLGCNGMQHLWFHSLSHHSAKRVRKGLVSLTGRGFCTELLLLFLLKFLTGASLLLSGSLHQHCRFSSRVRQEQLGSSVLSDSVLLRPLLFVMKLLFHNSWGSSGLTSAENMAVDLESVDSNR